MNRTSKSFEPEPISVSQSQLRFVPPRKQYMSGNNAGLGGCRDENVKTSLNTLAGEVIQMLEGSEEKVAQLRNATLKNKKKCVSCTSSSSKKHLIGVHIDASDGRLTCIVFGRELFFFNDSVTHENWHCRVLEAILGAQEAKQEAEELKNAMTDREFKAALQEKRAAQAVAVRGKRGRKRNCFSSHSCVMRIEPHVMA
eukprot:2122735-Rhodomonas_salina.1